MDYGQWFFRIGRSLVVSAIFHLSERKRRLGLSRLAIDAIGAERSDAEQFNAVLARLFQRRKPNIAIDGERAKSKLAWKAATYAEAVLYRVVALADGAAQNWNDGNVLCAILAGRALIETIALFLDVEGRLESEVAAESLAAIEKTLTSSIFASRLEDWLKDVGMEKATNVLTVIDKLDKLIPGVRRHCDLLSERAHPNYLGHSAFFSARDKSTFVTAYSLRQSENKEMFEHIFPGLMLIELFEPRQMVSRYH
jgi:hypothetical protein